MVDSILRPVALPPGLIGQPAPCDLFDVRGTLLLREGVEISPLMIAGYGERRLYCRATQAMRVSDAEPLKVLRDIGNALAMLDELLVGGQPVSADDFVSLATETYKTWMLDPDACIGFARMEQYDRPSVCHAVLAALFAAELAAAHGFSRQESITLIGAALTMNLGSLRLHDRMFAHAGQPDTEAREAIDAHPELAAQLLEKLGSLPETWLTAVRQHHEAFDGSGYPSGLSRTGISLHARMVRVADVLAARLRERKRRGPLFWSLHQARDPQRLLQHVFGPDLERLDHILARLLMGRLGSFPPGSVVRLSNGEMGIISRRSAEADGTPREVLAFLDTKGRPQHVPRPRRIGPRDCRIQGYAHDDQPRLPPYDWQSIWGYQRAPEAAKLM
ncbi:HD domain-containing protein [Azoarcus sp. L1K30]|uniref:HD-GYP domain-containing protein n=1 Tax=Azoarcus sp. L1K30 TaxID=2820277 RepID=UPI001B8246FC|nr:HD domain-containing phosphohydrolase [Azoarcus sp. L1K30]MBR0565528.1 HD domain-containing protein [Azoarcus sp. L1K30]